MKNSRSLNDLHPIVAIKATRFIRACADHGIELLILSTLRDEEEQARRYKLGRERLGPSMSVRQRYGHVVTDNPPGFSYHQFGLAFDCWPIVDSRIVLDYNNPDYSNVWRVMRHLAADPFINLRTGMEQMLSTGRREWGHFHYSAGLSIDALRAGYKLPDVQLDEEERVVIDVPIRPIPPLG